MTTQKIDIPEVTEFVQAQEALASFKRNNAEFFEMFESLSERYNRSFELANKAVREQKVSCGPFTMLGRPAVKWDAEKLYEEMGREFFLAHGGTIAQVPRYEIDKLRAEAIYALGQLPEEVAKIVRKEIVRYSTPEKLVLP